MRVHSIIISLVLGLLFIAISASSSAILKDPFLGIAPKDEKYYQSDTIACRDGSKKFARAQLNDDFCDCLDATDEPGTSACPGGKFYCSNLGHAPVQLFSSRVNDGICDCCDGSDEYDGTVQCPNTCWEAGKVARDKLTKTIATYQEGVTMRKQEIEQAKLDLAKDEADLSQLKSEEKILKGLVQQLKERKEQIERAEEQEKEKEEMEKKEAEEKANYEEAGEGKSEAVEKTIIKDKSLESTIDDTIGNVEDSTLEQHEEGGRETTVLPENFKEYAAVKSESDLDAMSKGKGSPDEVKKVGNDASEDTNGLSSEELGRLVASRWTGENSKKPSEGGDISKDNNHHEDNGEMAEDAYDDDYDKYASDTDDDSSRYGSYDDDDDGDVEDDIDDDFARTHDSSSSYEANSDHESDFSDIDTSSNPTWLEKLQQTVQNMLQAVNLLQTPVDKSEAELVRKEYEESSVKLSKIESRILKLTKKLKLGFGPEKEFYSFYGRCFEGRQSKYLYKVCPYKKASQTESYSTTGLGYWDKFDDVNKVMVFTNGDKCWNGPDRSLKVKLRCGLKNEITDVDEPSRCEYVALLSTPALCLEDKLKELQGKLESMNKEQPQGHDEL